MRTRFAGYAGYARYARYAGYARYVGYVGCVVVLAGCATNPATGNRQLMLMSEAQEVQIGRESDAEIRKQMGVFNDPQMQQYISGVGQRLSRGSERPSLPWTYTVVDSPAVNAFALPGGYVYLTRGMMPFLQDESELAAVLGHETGHVTARHSAAAYSREVAAAGGLGVLGIFVPQTQPLQGLASVSFQMLFLRNSRQNEIEADHLGTRYASGSGWDPQGMPDLLTTLGRLDEASGSSRGVPNWALTHPPAADRVAKVREAVTVARAAGGRATNREGFESRLNGLIYGDSREQGLVRGRDFVHPILRFALSFPESWEIANGAEQVSAREREEGQVGIILELAQGNGSPEQVARAQMTQAGLQLASGQNTDINGLPAFVGVYEGASNNTRVVIRAAHVRNQNQTYLIAGISSPQEFSRADRQFQNTIRSFRTISQQEADRIQPDRVSFYTARGGDTWDSLARGAGRGHVKPASLAIMNGASPATPPRPGDRIRIVVGG